MKIINLVENTKKGECLNEHGLSLLYWAGSVCDHERDHGR